MLYKINRDFYRVMSRNGKYIKRSRNVRLVGFSAAALLSIYLLLAVFPICYKDKDAEATVVPSTTTLSIVSSKDTASVEITPTSGAGTFATSAAADKAEFTVTTDNLTGYSLNLVGSDTSGQLVNSTTGDTLDTLTADVAESTFRTGAASTYANRWGYQLNVNSTTATNFLAAPTSGTKTIYTTTGPNTSADSYTLGIGARVDYAKPEGTYTNTFVLTAVGNPISYQINYLDNTGEGGTTGEDVSDLPTAEGSANVTASSFTLATGEPSRTGYNFVGWCYGTVNHNDDPSSCDGTTYQPGDTFTFTSIPSTGTATANLYAMWESAGGYIQDLNPSLCTTTPTTFVDKRDGNEYTVAKINGNCWMTQNLRYVGDTGSTSTSMIMKAATSNIASDQNLTIGDLTSGNDYNEARIHVATSDQVPSGASFTATDMGVWYNYAAASAGFVTDNQNSTAESTYSVCPAGWRLPTNSEQYGITSYLSQYPPVTGGYYTSGGVGGTGFGYWWSSTPYTSGSNYRYRLRYDGSLDTGGYDRYTGLYVRCILKQTMQNFTDAEASAMAVYETKQLEDARDGQKYDIVKLTNGDVWMAKNLAIGCAGFNTAYSSNFSTKNLTPEYSNVSNADYITPTTSLTSGNSLDAPRQTCNTNYGAWYNYAAASAGTITGIANYDDGIYDICPRGWHLPTYNEMSGIISNWNEMTAFNPAYGGYYENGSLRDTNDGKFWTATAAGSDTGRLIKSWTRNANGLASTSSSRSDGLYVRCIKNMRSMQSFTTDDADAMAVGETRTLKDARDGKKYTVAKLADGNVWMTENLNLAGGTALSADDTDVTSTYINGFTNGGNLTKNANNTISLPSSTTSGFNDNSNAFVYNTSNTSCGNNNPCYGYYSWIAATLGGKAANGSTAVTDNGYNATASICPKGWKLPSATTSNAPALTSPNWKTGDFYKLATAYGANLESNHDESAATFYNNAGPNNTVPNFLLAGYYESGSFSGGGSDGVYWSSSSNSSAYAHYLYFNSSAVYSANYGSRYSGYAVRCMLSDERTLDDITYLQEMNTAIAGRTATGTTKTLKDKRDNEEYLVGKLADGNIWLLDNLRLDPTAVSLDDLKGNTNATDQILTYFKNGGGSSPYPSSGVSDAWTSSSQDPYSLPYINTTDKNTVASATYGNGSGKIGVYYNFCAASAGSICTSSSYSDASYDICPAGWHIPTSGSVGEYQRLYTAYSSNANNFKVALSIPLSGRFDSGSSSGQGSGGFFWSSTYYTYGTSVYTLTADVSSVNPQNAYGRDVGFSVRCIAK